MDQILQIIICSISMILAIIMIIVILFNGKKSTTRSVWILYICCGFIWCSGMLAGTLYYLNIEWLMTQDLLFLIKPIDFYKYFAIQTQSAIWFLFCLSYSYKTLSTVEKKLYKHNWIIFILGFTYYFLLLGNESHGLIYYWLNENGIWVFHMGVASRIHSIKDFIFHFWGAVILLRHIRRAQPYHKKEWFIIMLSGIVPHLTCVIYYNTVLFHICKNFDFVPLFFLINLLIYNYVLLKHRFLNITPIAFPKMADELKESILIVDTYGIISYFNQSFKENFSCKSPINIDDEVTIFTKHLRNNTNMIDNAEKIIGAIESETPINIQGELYLNTYEKHFIVNIQPIYRKSNFIGRIITFYDITDYKNLLMEIENKNCKLEVANNQLKERANVTEELAIARERNRLAGDVHDSVGHTMTILISLIGVCSIACEKNIGTVREKLNEMMDTALKGYKELKGSVQGILSENQISYGIEQDLLYLIQDFEKTGVIVDFSVYGNENSAALFYRNTIYRICQEALTNSLRHGKATTINIILRFRPDLVLLYIIDDGIGCKSIKKNMGLFYMEKRVRELGGKISFGSDGEKGFNINVEFPLNLSSTVII